MQNIKTFKKKFKNLGINKKYFCFDPFPFEDNFIEPKRMDYKGPTIRYMHPSGFLKRLPLSAFKKRILLIAIDYFLIQNNNESGKWEGLCDYLGFKNRYSDSTVDVITPDDNIVTIGKQYKESILEVIHCYNHLRKRSLDCNYPDNWFDVIGLLMKYKGGPIGIDGDVLACYLFACPWDYLKYFKKDLTSKEIAEEIFYDNL